MPSFKRLSRRKFLGLAASTLAVTSGMNGLTGCTQSENNGNKTSFSHKKTSGTINVYNWAEYISNQVLKNFTKETGIEVIYHTFNSNEMMYKQLKSTNNNYDVVFPGTDFVSRMRLENMLTPLNHAKLPNFKNLANMFINTSIDPDNEFSIPYLWGSSGIAVNSKKVDISTISSWNDLWSPQFKDRVTLMDDMRDVFIMSLLALGYDSNSRDTKQIKQAYEKLVKLMPNVHMFSSNSPRIPFMQGEVDLGLAWNGEVIIAQNQGMQELDFIYPKEGVILWMDNMVIPKNAKNLDGAHQFIDFLLRPENSAIVSEEFGYASPNELAKNFILPEIAKNPIIYPPENLVNKSLFREDVGNEAIKVYQHYWNMLKATK